MTKEHEVNHAEQQAKAQFESIRDMVMAYELANDEDKRDEAQQAIQEDPLSVTVRSNWHEVGDRDNTYDDEYCILLCTGGPACRIIGELNANNQPTNAKIEYQDWGTPWTEYRLTSDEEQTVLKYCQCFYFGD